MAIRQLDLPPPLHHSSIPHNMNLLHILPDLPITFSSIGSP
jgi:hypothetical protein